VAVAAPLADDLLIEWVALASPAPGRSFLPYVEASAVEVRRSIKAIAREINADHLPLLYAPRVGGLGFTVTDAGERLGRAVVAQWLCGIAVGAFDATASLGDAEEWFFGDAATELRGSATAFNRPSLTMTSDEAYALLPYVLDRHRPGTRRELLRGEDSRLDRRRRKRDGVYYTPADVADAMTRLLGSFGRGSVIDPACGTGVFLRAAVERGASVDSVYGVDVDEHAVEAATFVLLAAALRTGTRTCSPWARWHQLRINFACMNSLRLRRGGGSQTRCEEVSTVKSLLGDDAPLLVPESHASRAWLGELFPQLDTGADAVISNPPYAPLGESASGVDPASFAAYGSTVRSSDRMEAAFAEFAWKLTVPNGAAALVLPLSVATSSRPEFVRLRSEIERIPGCFSFAMFDRAPDALFGDDVKTRNVIMLYESKQGAGTAIGTTQLLRWTSRNRTDFLRSFQFTEVKTGIASLVPKVGTSEEAKLYEALRSLEGCLGESVVASRVVLPQTSSGGGDQTVLVAPTAYNWIGVARETRPFAEQGHSSTSGMLELTFGDPVTANAAFALLSSKFVLWLWRAESDGFHVTTSFVLRLPFSLDRLSEHALCRLAVAGADLWQEAQGHPTISVNRRRTTVGFATSAMSLSAEIDREVAEVFGLPAGVRDVVRGWHDTLLVVDFAEERRVAAARARRISA
jgi:SAM-dependent methyltransferase